VLIRLLDDSDSRKGAAHMREVGCRADGEFSAPVVPARIQKIRGSRADYPWLADSGSIVLVKINV
jgi:hypothetical protein